MNYMTFTGKKKKKKDQDGPLEELAPKEIWDISGIRRELLKNSNPHTQIQEAIMSIKIKNKLLLKERINFKKEKEKTQNTLKTRPMEGKKQ